MVMISLTKRLMMKNCIFPKMDNVILKFIAMILFFGFVAKFLHARDKFSFDEFRSSALERQRKKTILHM